MNNEIVRIHKQYFLKKNFQANFFKIFYALFNFLCITLCINFLCITNFYALILCITFFMHYLPYKFFKHYLPKKFMHYFLCITLKVSKLLTFYALRELLY